MNADQQRFGYDDEVDLREVLQLLFRHWPKIAAITFLFAVLALGISLLLPKQYRASALIVITKPDVVFRFDPRITTQVEPPAGQAIQELTLSDEVIQSVINQMAKEGMGDGRYTVDVLRRRLDATLFESALELTATSDAPDRAEILANTWADVGAAKLNAIYASGFRDGNIFEMQAADALQEWEASQQALVEFQAENPERILKQRLLVLESSLSRYLEVSQDLSLVLQDTDALLSRLAQAGDDAGANLRSELAILMITTRSIVSNAGLSPFDVQLQLQGNEFIRGTVGEQIAYLETLIHSIELQKTEVTIAADDLQGEICDLQGQLALAEEERIILEQNKALAQEAYQTLSRTAQESSLSSEENGSVAQVASHAVVPAKPTGPRIGFYTTASATVGLILSSLSIIFSNYPERAPKMPRE